MEGGSRGSWPRWCRSAYQRVEALRRRNDWLAAKVASKRQREGSRGRREVGGLSAGDASLDDRAAQSRLQHSQGHSGEAVGESDAVAAAAALH